MTIPKLWEHQEYMAEFGLHHNRVLNTSDPGTAKTRGTVEAYARRLRQIGRPRVKRMLVIAPLSILQSAWGDDLEKFFPDLTYRIAHASSNLSLARLAAFESNADIVILNHDGI